MGFVVDDGKDDVLRSWTPPIKLRLEKNGRGGVFLSDENGWMILEVNSDGTITRCTSVGDHEHYQVDPDGRVIDTDIPSRRRRRK